MPSKQKSKGKGYENVVAKFLTDTYSEKFLRVPSSGAYLGGANFARRETMTEGQIRAYKGDIIPPDDWNFFNAECKFYAAFKFHQLYSESKILDNWILETINTSNANDLNLIFMKFNNIGEYIVYQDHEEFNVALYTRYKDGWIVTSKDQFWNKNNIDQVKARATGQY